MTATDPYRAPSGEERAGAVAALRAVLAHRPPNLDGLPLRMTPGTDEAGRPFTMLADTSTGWGTVLVRTPSRVLIEVPHPGSDRLTARLGLELFHAVPTAALLVAGAHRNAGDGAADVAHRPESLFHAYAQTLAIPEIQVHGFAEETARNIDAVVSPGIGEPSELHRHVEKALVRQGFRVGHHERLAGRTNVQGIAAAASGRPFLHLELAPALRADRHVVVRVLVDAIGDAIAS